MARSNLAIQHSFVNHPDVQKKSKSDVDQANLVDVSGFVSFGPKL